MTREQFVNIFRGTTVIKCSNPGERDHILNLLRSNGYCISNASSRYIDIGPSIGNDYYEYLNPSYGTATKYVSCYSSVPNDFIMYEDAVKALSYDSSYAEFESAFNDLMDDMLA